MLFVLLTYSFPQNLQTENRSNYFQFFYIFKDSPLLHNASDGVILTNQSLVLQQIDRQRTGAYTCEAINTIGKGSSLPIFLDVKCELNFFLLICFLYLFCIDLLTWWIAGWQFFGLVDIHLFDLRLLNYSLLNCLFNYSLFIFSYFSSEVSEEE